jgi:hypothetical protein
MVDVYRCFEEKFLPPASGKIRKIVAENSSETSVHSYPIIGRHVPGNNNFQEFSALPPHAK